MVESQVLGNPWMKNEFKPASRRSKMSKKEIPGLYKTEWNQIAWNGIFCPVYKISLINKYIFKP